jgi:AcrR family transcriptional regulator
MQGVQEQPRGGLRERKKWQTHKALSMAAGELVTARGLEAVTVEDIAAAADVSVRTFFNYFSCKEEAIVGVEPAVLDEMAEELRQRPQDESPAEALRAVLLAEVDADGMLKRWRLRNELVRRYPALLPRYLASMVELEEVLTTALADRIGVDEHEDHRPRVLVAAALAVLRSTLGWWADDANRAETKKLTDVLERTFATLVPDLPRNE